MNWRDSCVVSYPLMLTHRNTVRSTAALAQVAVMDCARADSKSEASGLQASRVLATTVSEDYVAPTSFRR